MSERSRATAAFDVVVVAAWAALLAGLIEASRFAFLLWGRNEMVFVSRDFAWMAPLGYLLLFLVPATLLAGVAAAWPRVLPLRLVVLGFVTTAVFGAALPFTQIARYALLLLAMGVGVQLARVIGASPGRWRPRLRGHIAIAIGLFGLAGVVTRTVPSWRERSRLAALPPATDGAPNVLVIILDTVRAASMSLYGYERETTPNLSKRAAEAVTFDRAYATAPWTLPSHGTVFTGFYPEELTADWTVPIDGRHTTLAESFAEHGYLTAGFTANHNYTSYDSGLGRGFAHYEDYKTTLWQIISTTALGQANSVRTILRWPSWQETKSALTTIDLDVPRVRPSDPKHGDEITRDFLAWQASAPRRPFFAFLNYFDAHGPQHAPGEFATKFTAKPRDKDRYDGAIAFLDSQLATLLNELERRGLLDKTVVVITSDHGELWGEHKLRGHAHNLYEPVLRVPLLIRYPARLTGGTRVLADVSLRDLASTIADLAQLPEETRFPGSSLAGIAAGDGTADRSPIISQVRRGVNLEAYLPAAKGAMRSLVRDGRHLIVNGDGVLQLFDLRADSAEINDLVRTAEGRAHAEAMRRELDQGLVRR